MEKYAIENIVTELSGLDFIDVLVKIKEEVKGLELIKIDRKNADYYSYSNYKKYCGDFLYFLNTGSVPVGIGIDGLRLFLPVIKSLASKGQLKKEALDLF